MRKNLFVGGMIVGAVFAKLGYNKIVADNKRHEFKDVCEGIDQMYKTTCNYKELEERIAPYRFASIEIYRFEKEEIDKLDQYIAQRINYKHWLGCEEYFNIELLEHPEYVLKELNKLQHMREMYVTIEPESFEEFIEMMQANAAVKHLSDAELTGIKKISDKACEDYKQFLIATKRMEK